MSSSLDKREQIFQELLAQDASLAGQKKEILGLLERMESNRPEVAQDPMFFGRLKDKLRYHLITRHEPAPTPNLWQKFMLYGFPTLAIGVALLYILPGIPFSQPTPYSNYQEDTFSPILLNSDESLDNEDTTYQESRDISSSTIEQTILPSQNNTPSEKAIELSSYSATNTAISQDTLPPDMPTQSPSIMPASYKIDETTSMSNEELLLRNNNFEYYTRGTSSKEWHIDYNVDENENITDGLFLVRSCDKLFTLTQPISLSRAPGLWHMTALPFDGNGDKSYELLITIDHTQIISIEGYEQLCQ